MDTVFRLVKGVSVFIIPLLITGFPLTLFLFLRQLNRIRQSTELTAVAAAVSTFIGWWTPFGGTMICAGLLASGMPDNRPKCVTGAVLFLPVGYLITGVTLVIGLIVTVQMLLNRTNV